jgi:hypothetical protein
VAETAVITPRGVHWRVVSTRGDITVEAHGETEGEAWHRARLRADRLGLLSE